MIIKFQESEKLMKQERGENCWVNDPGRKIGSKGWDPAHK